MGSRRRLRSDENTGNIFSEFFNDDTNDSDVMRAHLFYLCTLIFLVLCFHKLIYLFCKWKGFAVPPILVAPGVEVQMFLALFMVRGKDTLPLT